MVYWFTYCIKPKLITTVWHNVWTESWKIVRMDRFRVCVPSNHWDAKHLYRDNRVSHYTIPRTEILKGTSSLFRFCHCWACMLSLPHTLQALKGACFNTVLSTFGIIAIIKIRITIPIAKVTKIEGNPPQPLLSSFTSLPWHLVPHLSPLVVMGARRILSS